MSTCFVPSQSHLGLSRNLARKAGKLVSDHGAKGEANEKLTRESREVSGGRAALCKSPE